MLTPFFSKKQKADFRQRRRRLKKEVVKTSDASATEVQSPTETTPHDNGSSEEVTAAAATNQVIIPKDLSSQELKKFRKDARRKARAEGNDPSKLVFIVEGTKPETISHNTNKPEEPKQPLSSKSKKRKREFPRLNDLVKEQQQEKEKKAADSARKASEEVLAPEYKSRYLALDCEMVGIGTDGRRSVLARASIVDWDGNLVFDTFVQVPTRVTDFRTHVSGVTAKDIKSNAGALKETECREKVAKLLHGKILVGHALKNDLQALLLKHPKEAIRDTAKYRPFQRLGGTKWRPRKLRDLVKENLDLSIQQDGQAHDSIQDAAATMQLFRLVREKWEEELREQALHKNKKRKTT